MALSGVVLGRVDGFGKGISGIVSVETLFFNVCIASRVVYSPSLSSVKSNTGFRFCGASVICGPPMKSDTFYVRLDWWDNCSA